MYGAAGSQNLPQIQAKENCVSNTCLKFDGTDDYIDFGNILNPSRIENRTYLFWVKLDSYGGAIFSTGNLSNDILYLDY